jgi:hypothetical protein
MIRKGQACWSAADAKVCLLHRFILDLFAATNFRSSTPIFGSTTKLQHIPSHHSTLLAGRLPALLSIQPGNELLCRRLLDSRNLQGQGWPTATFLVFSLASFGSIGTLALTK